MFTGRDSAARAMAEGRAESVIIAPLSLRLLKPVCGQRMDRRECVSAKSLDRDSNTYQACAKGS